jgi:hypothetical protein
MWAVGRITGSSSIPPHLMDSLGPQAAAWAYNGDPHAEQKCRNSPGLDWNALTKFGPLVTTKSLSWTSAFVAKDDPVAFRHMLQWQ